jgi:uncharacterized protein YjiS (DUF1127 family)
MFHSALDKENGHLLFLECRQRLGHLLARFRQLWQEWKQRRHFRSELCRLMRISPRLVVDIGLTVEEALREIEKPFWRP